MSSSPVSSAEVELLEAEAFAELHGQFALEAGSEFAVVKRLGRSAVLASPVVDAVAVNRAIGFGFERPLDANELATVRDFFRQHRKRRWFVDCSPEASIDRTALSSAGGVIAGSVIKLVADVTALGGFPDPGLEVEVITASDAVRFRELVGPQLGVPEPVRPGIASTIGRPGWQFYFALKDSRPIARRGDVHCGRRRLAWIGRY